MRISFLKIYYSRVIKKIIGLLTPQEQLLDEYESYLDFISTYFWRKGLEKKDVYNQAYLKLYETHQEFPTITDKILKNKVTHTLWNYLRKEQRYRKKYFSFEDLYSDKKTCSERKFSDKVGDQITEEYVRDNDRLFSINILGSIEDEQEKEILNMYLLYGYKDREIADFYKLSHQRINKIKSRALKKIKEYLL